MILKQLPPINKPLLIFGGPYSNLEALLALKSFALQNQFDPDQIICTGDIVGYCANPSESLDFIEDWDIHCIAGNVELNIKEDKEDCGCNFDEGSRCDIFSRQWYPYAYGQMTERNRKFIHSLPEYLMFEFFEKKVFVLHGSYKNTSEFIFKSYPAAIKRSIISACSADLVIAGHSGIPFYQQFDNQHWLNAGVIGMPANDGNTKTWLAVLNMNDQQLSPNFHSLKYDHKTAAQKMKDKGLPLSYANTLLNGVWDNCDILPEQETEEQGIPLEF
jgi:predicted phosphodiesterase